MKERDEAWMRVEALAMRHPNYIMANKGTTNNTYISPQHIDNSPPDEDGDTDQTPLTLEKIEAKANEVYEFISICVNVFQFDARLYKACQYSDVLRKMFLLHRRKK